MGLDTWPGNIWQSLRFGFSPKQILEAEKLHRDQQTLARELPRQCLSPPLLGIALKTIKTYQNNGIPRTIVGIAKAATVLSKRSWIWQLALAISR